LIPEPNPNPLLGIHEFWGDVRGYECASAAQSSSSEV